MRLRRCAWALKAEALKQNQATIFHSNYPSFRAVLSPPSASSSLFQSTPVGYHLSIVTSFFQNTKALKGKKKANERERETKERDERKKAYEAARF
jgi:hypothetical protein